MDEIQKALIKAGRKDLAQKYYKKIAIHGPSESAPTLEEDRKAFNEIRPALESIFKDIDDVVNKRIRLNVSKTNASNYIVAFLNAINDGTMPGYLGFDSNKAKLSIDKNFFKYV